MTAVLVYYVNYSLLEFFTSILFCILLAISLYYLSLDTIISLAFFTIICYYFLLRLNEINYNFYIITKCKIKYKTKVKYTNDLLKQHNSICIQISDFNRFWSKYYFCLIITIMPLNIIILVMILFTKVHFSVVIVYLFTFIISWFMIFIISFLTSL